jgi:hypothetical protein
VAGIVKGTGGKREGGEKGSFDAGYSGKAQKVH